MISQGKYKILFNKEIAPGYFRMAVFAPRIAKAAKPGQFVHLRCQDSLEPLLRRPLSFHRLHQDRFELLYKVVGRGTNLLAKKQKGDKIDLLGPLGNGFSLPPTTYHLPPILVAGGMGVAPLLALAEELVKGKRSKVKGQRANNTLVLLGAKNKKEILCAEDFKRLGAKVQIATDDGTRGHKGLVTDLLKRILPATSDQRPATIYACGPKLMLKEISRLSRRFGISAQGSLEEHLGCGVGACLGCAVKTRQGYQQVCKHGPVFNLKEIKWPDVSR